MNLSGILSPIPTPFDDRDRVDTARLKAALSKWMTKPLTGIVVLGSNGEAALMDDFECDQAIVAARDAVPREKTFIVGTGRESTQGAINATKRAAEHGADAVLVRTPGFFKSQMTNDVFVRHYTAVADASPVPVLLYNFTAVTGVNLPSVAVSTLSAHPNVIGVKESSGDVAQIAEFVKGSRAGFNVLAGSSTTFYAALGVGAVGGVLALSCVLPDACVRVRDLTRGGKDAEASALQTRLMPMAKLVGSLHGIAGLKAALKLVGCDVGDPRSPLAPVSDATVAVLREALVSFEEVALV
jgi:4-hydroxy-2-oxoglutarate aldolase